MVERKIEESQHLGWRELLQQVRCGWLETSCMRHWVCLPQRPAELHPGSCPTKEQPKRIRIRHRMNHNRTSTRRTRGGTPSRHARTLNGARAILRGARLGDARGDASPPSSPPTGEVAKGDADMGPPSGLAASPDLYLNSFLPGLRAPGCNTQYNETSEDASVAVPAAVSDWHWLHRGCPS